MKAIDWNTIEDKFRAGVVMKKSSWIKKNINEEELNFVLNAYENRLNLDQAILYISKRKRELGRCAECNQVLLRPDRRYCSKKCSANNPENKKIKADRYKEEMLKRYGVTNTWARDETKRKIAETNLKRYGDTSHTRNDEIKSKIRESMLLSKGFRLNFPREYRRMTDEQIYDSLFVDGDVRHIHEAAKKLNITYTSARVFLAGFDKYRKPQSRSSNAEAFFRDEITEMFQITAYSGNRKILGGKEIDIWIPDHNLGIEYHGLYWHSGASKRHKEKYQNAADTGISLLQFWSSEVEDQHDIVMSIIASKIGKTERLYARKCAIKEISSMDHRRFCKENHLQGPAGASVRLGLFYEGELVSVMSFGKSRYGKKYEWEMIRFCNKKFLTIVGGASKLWKYFLKSVNPESVVTYADARISSGELYDRLGFAYSHHSSPNYFYTKDFKNLESRIKYQKHKLKDMLEHFDPCKTEIDNMMDNGYSIISDAGNLVYEWRKYNEGN